MNKYTDPYTEAIENIQKVLDYLKDNDDFDCRYYRDTTFLTVDSRIAEECGEESTITFGLEFYGQKDGILTARIAIRRHDYYYTEEVWEGNFGSYLYGYEIDAVNKLYKKAIKFTKELKNKFEFIEIEK